METFIALALAVGACLYLLYGIASLVNLLRSPIGRRAFWMIAKRAPLQAAVFVVLYTVFVRPGLTMAEVVIGGSRG